MFAGDEVTAHKDPVSTPDPTGGGPGCAATTSTTPAGADGMYTRFATSPDGLDWTLDGTALAPRPGAWDARGVRVASVLARDGAWGAYYDGRATAEQNWYEQTGIAEGATPDRLTATTDAPVAVSPHGEGGFRYVDVVDLGRRRPAPLLRGGRSRRRSRPPNGVRAARPVTPPVVEGLGR